METVFTSDPWLNNGFAWPKASEVCFIDVAAVTNVKMEVQTLTGTNEKLPILLPLLSIYRKKVSIYRKKVSVQPAWAYLRLILHNVYKLSSEARR